MKIYNYKFHLYNYALIIVCLLITGCQKFIDEDDINDAIPDKSVKIVARSSSNNIEYPLYIFIFSDTGENKAFLQANSESDKLDIKLSDGKYKVIAISGAGNIYSETDTPDIEDIISFSENCYGENAIMMGKGEVTVNKQQTNLNITLSYCITSVNISLSNIPDEMNDVSFSISPLYYGISLNGDYQYDKVNNSMKLPCSRNEDGTWKAGPVYIFPGSENTSVFSIVAEDENTTHNYSYTYNGTPRASYPLVLNGSYDGNITVGNNITCGTWNDPVIVGFYFNANGGSTNGTPEEGNQDTSNPSLSTIPEAGDIWNGCIVANVKTEETKTTLLLLSLKEWECKAAQAESIPSGYSVNNLSGWKIPSYEEAGIFRAKLIGDNLINLNDKIIAAGGDKIYSDADSRFICYGKEGGLYTFRFSASSNITLASETKTYYLRLTKEYSFTNK